MEPGQDGPLELGEHAIHRDRLVAAYHTVQLAMGHSPQSLAPRLTLVECVPSTNQTAWDLWDEFPAVPPCVLARSQTAGRGQWGRHWRSAPGGLYLSVGAVLDLPVEHAAQLTLGTAWGIAQALRQVPGRLSGVTTEIPVQLKWLNDLVLQGYKLGGILTETRVQGDRIVKAVIGVGVNWANPVPDTGIALRQFLATHPTPLIESLEMLAAIALYGIETGLDQLQQQGIDKILSQYFELLAHRDRVVPLAGQLGRIVGIAPTGELRLQFDHPVATQATPPGNSTLEVSVKPGTINFGYPL